jgi:ribose 5-phosphate isomerase A
MTADDLKKTAAAAALALVEPGMRLGLGTGSTARHFVDLLGVKVAAGFQVLCVPTSEVTAAQARALSIPLTTLDETPELDLTVDGADEIDGDLTLIKGAGGALLREKIVASVSARMVVIADDTKHVAHLGAFPLPVEVNVFGFEATRRAVERACAHAGAPGNASLRLAADGSPYITDGGHRIVECRLGRITDPEKLSHLLLNVPGVVEHGLFIGLCATAFIASQNGVAVLQRSA